MNYDPFAKNEKPAKIIVREESGEFCSCGSCYAYTQYSDGSLRYELTQVFDGKTYMTEWRDVASYGEFEVAINAYGAAWHGARH